MRREYVNRLGKVSAFIDARVLQSRGSRAPLIEYLGLWAVPPFGYFKDERILEDEP